MSFQHQKGESDRLIGVSLSDDNLRPIHYDPYMGRRSVDIIDLGTAVTETVIIAAYNGLTDREIQEQINDITSQHGVLLLFELIRFTPQPTQFPADAGPADFGAEHVARILNTLEDNPGTDRNHARFKLATLCLGLFGWTVPTAAAAVLEQWKRPGATPPNSPLSQAAQLSVQRFASEPDEG